jgi:hypothetical protein
MHTRDKWQFPKEVCNRSFKTSSRNVDSHTLSEVASVIVFAIMGQVNSCGILTQTV